MSGELVAHKPPSAVNPNESSRYSGPSTQAAADFDAASRTVEFQASGRSPQGEEPAWKASSVLLAYLNHKGASWTLDEPTKATTRTEQGWDCLATSPNGAKLLIQHTRADGDQTLWAGLRVGVERTYAIPGLVAALRGAIENKQHVDGRETITLLLDASLSLGAGLRAVADAFVESEGSWAKSVGYRDIWLVGPSTDLVFPLA